MNAIPVPFDQPAIRRPSPFTLAVALAVTLPLLLCTASLAAWLAATRPSTTLGSHPSAASVRHAFSSIAPYKVQRDMGASEGKDADCRIYSDGSLDRPTRVNGVTWAVTLCTVHPVGVVAP